MGGSTILLLFWNQNWFLGNSRGTSTLNLRGFFLYQKEATPVLADEILGIFDDIRWEHQLDGPPEFFRRRELDPRVYLYPMDTRPVPAGEIEGEETDPERWEQAWGVPPVLFREARLQPRPWTYQFQSLVPPPDIMPEITDLEKLSGNEWLAAWAVKKPIVPPMEVLVHFGTPAATSRVVLDELHLAGGMYL